MEQNRVFNNQGVLSVTIYSAVLYVSMAGYSKEGRILIRGTLMREVSLFQHHN